MSEKKVVPVLPPRPRSAWDGPRAMIDLCERGVKRFHDGECSRSRGPRLPFFSKVGFPCIFHLNLPVGERRPFRRFSLPEMYSAKPAAADAANAAGL
jgi:hypothetical protein